MFGAGLGDSEIQNVSSGSQVKGDHHSLCWLRKKRDLAGRMARWSLQFQNFDITTVHHSYTSYIQTRMFCLVIRLTHSNPKPIPLCRNFEIRNCVLYHPGLANGKSFYRLYLPPERVEQALTACHAKASAGHSGVDRRSASDFCGQKCVSRFSITLEPAIAVNEERG